MSQSQNNRQDTQERAAQPAQAGVQPDARQSERPGDRPGGPNPLGFAPVGALLRQYAVPSIITARTSARIFFICFPSDSLYFPLSGGVIR